MHFDIGRASCNRWHYCRHLRCRRVDHRNCNAVKEDLRPGHFGAGRACAVGRVYNETPGPKPTPNNVTTSPAAIGPDNMLAALAIGIGFSTRTAPFGESAKYTLKFESTAKA